MLKPPTYTLIIRGNGARIFLVFESAGSGVVHARNGTVLARNVQSAILNLLHAAGAEEVANQILHGIGAESAVGGHRSGTAEEDGGRVSHLERVKIVVRDYY